jgi:peptidoglycan lytic transglycosylase
MSRAVGAGTAQILRCYILATEPVHDFLGQTGQSRCIDLLRAGRNNREVTRDLQAVAQHPQFAALQFRMARIVAQSGWHPSMAARSQRPLALTLGLMLPLAVSLASADDKPCLPKSGKASSYSDIFVGKATASGEIYSHDKYTAAVMPKARWNCVPMKTVVKIKHNGKTLVVKINDKGAGDGSMKRVLDLSRISMSYLVGKELKTEKDALAAGVIDLDSIEVVPDSTRLGPVK